jgi:hypothetical protein
MIRDRDSNHRVFYSFLHYDVATSLADFRKALTGGMAQTSRPDKTRNLPNLDLKPGDENLGVSTALNLRAVGSLKKQLDCFLQIFPGFFDGIAECGIWKQCQRKAVPSTALALLRFGRDDNVIRRDDNVYSKHF